MSQPNWSQAELFPVIAEAIERVHSAEGTWVTHDRIVSYLLNSPEASVLIRQAAESGDSGQSAEWHAHNVVAWFSQRITVGESDWSSRFVREKVDGKWAYKPAAP